MPPGERRVNFPIHALGKLKISCQKLLGRFKNNLAQVVQAWPSPKIGLCFLFGANPIPYKWKALKIFLSKTTVLI